MDKNTINENTSEMSYIAAIDIGSNALRLAIARITSSGIHISYKSRAPVRLGASVFGTGQIDSETLEELKTALKQFKNQLENHNVLKYRAIATSAMREAQNGQSVVDQLFKATGLKVEIISGEEEAQLVSTAISQKVDLNEGNHLLIDIGGGSIELVALVEGELIKKQSFVLGMVRILEIQKNKKQELKKWLPEFIQGEVMGFFKDLPSLKTAVGTGGNMDRFIKLKEFISDEEGIGLTKSEMKQVYKLLTQVSYEERILQYALKPDRADVIVPAAIATLKFMDIGKCDDILIPQVGIKDGVLFQLSSESEN